MINIVMAIVTVLLVLGFTSNFILFGVFSMMENDVGLIVCAFIFVLYVGIFLGCVYFYNLDKCDKFSDEKKHFKEDISRLQDDIDWYEKKLRSYKKLDKYVKEHYDYETKQSELERENEKLKNIIRTQNNVKTEDFEQYLKVMMEDKNE